MPDSIEYGTDNGSDCGITCGIDLGTTDSAVAVVEDGTVSLVRNSDGEELTPSVVWMREAGTIYVGRRARERAEVEPDNVAAEFKLQLGLDDAGHSFAAAGVRLTPQELSVEVLKSLRADAAHYTGRWPTAAVIATPTAFAAHQQKATVEAAMLAGFGADSALVPEPVAAALAYGIHDAGDRASWLVLDFGGSGFDAAVVGRRDGAPRVLSHAGDPFLGGALIDQAVVYQLLAPAAARELGLADHGEDSRFWRRNAARLKLAAEEATLRLCEHDRHELLVELTVGDGQTEPFEFTLRRDQVDRVAEPFYARAVALSRLALTDLAPGQDAFDRLLLVGSVTLAPGLRQLLADPDLGLGIEPESSLDPTTVVARGAAVASSQDLINRRDNHA